MRFFITNRALWRKLEQLENIMATVPAGLASLTQAVTDLTAEVSAATTRLADLASQLTALNSEDPQVQALAGQIEDQVTALKNAVTPAA